MERQGRRTGGLWRTGVGLGLGLVLSLIGWGQAVQVERPVGHVIPPGGTDGQGWRQAGAGQVVLTYTVRNTGGAQLDVTGITASDLQNVAVSSIAPTTFSLAPAGTQAVEVRYTPTTDGPFSFALTITSNAPAYAWTVSGDGDGTPPTVPNPLTPGDGQWFRTTAVGFTWGPSTDDGSGVRDYRVLISGPVNRDYYTGNTFYNPTGLVEGAYTWRLRARDWVGNVSAYTADRAFAIDLTPPTDPTLSSPSHTVGVPSNNPGVQIQATGAADPISGGVSSGIGGFEVAWDQSPTWLPSQVANRGAGWTGETFGATSDGSWWVHVATRDVAGNWTATVHFGPFQIDTELPSVVSVTVDRNPVYEGGLSQRVTVTFHEAMDPGTPPTIGFTAGAFASQGDGAWSSGDTVWTETFWHNGAEEEVTGVAVTVENARDRAENVQVPYTSAPLFDIDTRKPRATVATDRTTIAGGSPIYEGALTLTVTVSYDEDMDQLTTPTIVLVDAGTNWTGPAGGGWTDARTYVATFTHNGTEETIVGTAFARVADGSGARDLAGNADLGADSPLFDIDTRKPRVISIEVDHTTIVGGEPGKGPIYEGSLVLTVTVTYDEGMDPSTSPGGINLINGGDHWSGPINGAWTSATVYRVQFVHDGTEEEIPGGTYVSVDSGSGARDLAGNADLGDDSPPFDIDTRKPRATVATDRTTIAGGSPIYEGALTLTVTVSYDEDMDQLTTPTIVLVDAGTNWTGPAGGGWTDARTYVATFTHNGTPEEIAGARARVVAGGATDLAGNTDLGATSPPFDIDTKKPTIVLIVADESGICGLADYVLGTVCPPGAFAVTVTFSEAVWQGAGDELVLTFNLDQGAPGGTLVFAGIAPHSTGAPDVWQPQVNARTYVVQDGDNACRLAVTGIAGVVYDVAGNALAVPTAPLGSDHNLTDRQDILVDTTRPEIHDLMFHTDASYTVRATDYYVDDCCTTTVYFSAHVTDNCYVLPENVHVTVTLPTGNAILEDVVVERTPVAPNRVHITGSAVVRCLTGCPARVEVRVEARDGRGGPECCGNWAIPQTTPPDEGLVWDTVPPIPRDDPRQDMVMDESAIIDPLVEVRRDDLGVYRLVVRENTPVRIDVLRNDADNCSCRCEGGAHPFDPCGPCASCPGCCAALFLHEIVDPPTYGTATIEDETGDCGGGSVVRYAPKLGYVGPDWFTYTIRDACGNVSAIFATVYLQVIPQLAMEDVFVVACAGRATEFTVRAADLWVDYDPHDVPFRFTVVAGPEHGALAGDPAHQKLAPYSTEVVGGQLVPTLTFVEATSIGLVYVPAIGYTGADEIWIRLEDPFGAAQTARVAVSVVPCEAVGVDRPTVTVVRGDPVPIIPPAGFSRMPDGARPSPAFLSLEDGTGFIQAVSIVWSERAQRPIVVVDTAGLPAGRYLLVLRFGEDPRVELVIVVKEKA